MLFHPKQLLLLSSCDAGEVRVWDLVTKACAFKLVGHMSAVPALSLSPDGWHLLSGGRDRVVCTWDIRNGSRIGTVPVYEAIEGVCIIGSAFSFAAACCCLLLAAAVPWLRSALQWGLQPRAGPHFHSTPTAPAARRTG